MKTLKIFAVVIGIMMITAPGFAQDKSETKSTLYEGYMAVLKDAKDAIIVGGKNVDNLLKTEIDTLLRECAWADVQNIFESIDENIAGGKFKKSPKLLFGKVDGKFPFKGKTMRAYKKDLQKIIKESGKKTQNQSLEEFIMRDKVLKRAGKQLYKEAKNHFYQRQLRLK